MPRHLLKRLWYDTPNEHPAALCFACASFGVKRLMVGPERPVGSG